MITTTRNVGNDSEVAAASPARLYKYRSMAGAAAQWTESIVRKNEIFFATRRHFNDPFDCRPRFVTKAQSRKSRSFFMASSSRADTVPGGSFPRWRESSSIIPFTTMPSTTPFSKWKIAWRSGPAFQQHGENRHQKLETHLSRLVA
jgi:hypothetical protein